MAGSQNNRGHRHRPDHGGHFWRRGESFCPLTLEMTTSDAWRTLTLTARCVLLDMLSKFWRASRGDVEPLKNGFRYTFRDCGADCSPATFSNAMRAIVAAGWFHRMNGKGPVAKYAPGPWRKFTDPSLSRMDAQQKTAKKPRKSTGCRGRFWKPGQAFTQVTQAMLESDAWRVLTPAARCVLLDMLHAYYDASFSDTQPRAIKYGFSTNYAGFCENVFYRARKELVDAHWFRLKMVGDEGRYFPGDWRNFKAPENAKFRNTARVKADYLARQEERAKKNRTRTFYGVKPSRFVVERPEPSRTTLMFCGDGGVAERPRTALMFCGDLIYFHARTGFDKMLASTRSRRSYLTYFPSLQCLHSENLAFTNTPRSTP